ncbi:MAG: hypothetical protein H7144_04845 [Burkholderiales bacterium]|nr:hypothetical protein [Phycisphaerae bacterium]
MTETSASSPSAPIVATAGRYYRNARYIMVAAVLAFAIYFAYDGWRGYPELNRKIAENNAAIDRTQALPQPTDADRAHLDVLNKRKIELGKDKTPTDIALQKALALSLPLLALGYLAFVIRRSRGEIRLENDTLTVPGHPPVQLSAITSVNNSAWKKKGIVYVAYSVDGRAGTITLDDFVYQQKPIDDIYEILARRFGVWQEAVAEPS